MRKRKEAAIHNSCCPFALVVSELPAVSVILVPAQELIFVQINTQPLQARFPDLSAHTLLAGRLREQTSL